jgi:hypothetical protein
VVLRLVSGILAVTFLPLPSLGTPEGTVTKTLFVSPSSRPAEGTSIEILYDPADPSNFEPVATGASSP